MSRAWEASTTSVSSRDWSNDGVVSLLEADAAANSRHSMADMLAQRYSGRAVRATLRRWLTCGRVCPTYKVEYVLPEAAAAAAVHEKVHTQRCVLGLLLGVVATLGIAFAK